MRLACRCLMMTALLALPAAAEDDKARLAREELERELRQLVGAQPTRVRVEFEALDEPTYALVDATFELDGKPLRAPPLPTLAGEGRHLLWEGAVTPGKHLLRARVAYANQASALITEEGGHTWKISGDVSFQVNAGIEVQVRVVPIRDGQQQDITKRFRLSLPAQPVMLARLDDGTMPEPLVRRVEPKADAGAPLQVAVARGDEKAALLAEPPPAPRAEPEPAPEAEPAPVAAAEPRLAAAEARPAPAAPAPQADPPSAGGPVAVERPAPPAGSPPSGSGEPASPAQPEAVDGEGDDGTPWLALGGGGAVALVLALVLFARRRSRPPSLD